MIRLIIELFFLFLFLFVCWELAWVGIRLGLKNTIKGLALLFFSVGYRRKSASITRKSKKKILVLGDSTIVAPGAPQSKTPAALLAKKMNASLIHLAVNGSRTRDICGQFKDVATQKFDLVLISVGNNDIWKFTDLRTLPGDVNNLLAAVRPLSKHIVLFRGGNIGNCPAFPRMLRDIYTLRSRKVKYIFENAAKKHGVIYVEKWMERKDDIFLKRPYYYYSWDLLHLNENGMRVWFAEILTELHRKKIV